MRGTSTQPLLAHLCAQPPEQGSITLSFAALAALTGPLSVSARTSRSYWHHVVRGARWRPHDWGARLDVEAGTVTFTRRVSVEDQSSNAGPPTAPHC